MLVTPFISGKHLDSTKDHKGNVRRYEYKKSAAARQIMRSKGHKINWEKSKIIMRESNHKLSENKEKVLQCKAKQWLVDKGRYGA